MKESAAERRWQKSLKIYATEMPRKPHETKATSILMVDYNSCHIQIKTWEEILWSIIGPESLILLELITPRWRFYLPPLIVNNQANIAI